ncbi:methyltransferase [Streptomyces sp. WAC06614]|uniref:methyltransferase n=1 Tax=Streptomyces sp. WAC06614 TaxID=2487416 RepID=UPI000F76899E|nr:methyltransferase [Streptomyces sp. WAC06614]RSS82230.1 methyltransferase domain-containing protein [Streptomyces sp. WAC06614]
MPSQQKSGPEYERFDFLMNAPALFNAAATAAELGIFIFLSENPGSDFASLRKFTGVPEHQLRVLLQAVCAAGLMERTDGAYRNSAVAQDLLASDEPDSWAHTLIGWKEIYYPAFGQMTKALKAGTNTALESYPGDEPTLYKRLTHNPELEAVFHKAMAAFTLASINDLVEREEFAAVTNLLDIGGGDSTTTARLLERHPRMRSTVFDQPSVSRLAHGKEAQKFLDRIDLVTGDFFDTPFPKGSDAVLFSHVLGIFSAEQIVTLLKKAYDVLPPGGQVFIYDYNVTEDETKGIYGARLGLYFNILASGTGMAYPAEDFEGWLTEVGFENVRTVSELDYEHGFHIGVKP